VQRVKDKSAALQCASHGARALLGIFVVSNAAALQSVLWAVPAHAARASSIVVDVRRAPYGAKCDWDGKRGTDDTAAFEAAAAAASDSYRKTGRPVEVRVGTSCEVASTVTFGSGVHWTGPGTVYVPDQTRQVFLARNADEVSVEGITIEVLGQDCGTNKATCSAIDWESTADDLQAHTHVSVRNNIIHHANWGILIGYAAGRGSLSDVEIEGNVISSPSPYMDADAIHIGGRVHHFSIIDNRIFNRGDAGVAASSEVQDYICSDGRIEGNVLIEDQVGLDNSGCTNTLWKGNFVRATTPPHGSNPAFRSITYLRLTSSNVTALGNYLQNASGVQEYAAKVDEIAGKSGTRAFFWGNTIVSPWSLYLRGSLMEIAGNTFTSNNSTLTIDYDGPHEVPTDSISIGRNRWLGAGIVRSGSSRNLLTHLSLDPQLATVPLAYTNRDIFAPGREGKTTDETASGPSLATDVLRGQTSRADAQRLTAGSCFSVTAQVRGAVPSMSVRVTDAGLTRWPEGFIAWGFVSSQDVVTVRTCAVQLGVFPSVTFRVVVQ
jgi:Right handed beta helix region